MARDRAIFWRCDHHYRILVENAVAGGRRARCLGCRTSGPMRAGSEEAMLALRAEALYKGKIGA